MSASNFNQRRFLLNKAGIGVPQMPSEAKANTNNQKPQTPQPQPQPKKPGCSACSRRKMK